jgi:hypothetical protein
LQLLACAALALDTLAGACAQLLHAARELVAYALELAEIEQRRTVRASPAAARHGCRDVRKALGDDRGALALESRDLCPQRGPCGALVDVRAALAGGTVEPRPDRCVTPSVERPLLAAVSIDDSMLLVGHTRLLACNR